MHELINDLYEQKEERKYAKSVNKLKWLLKARYIINSSAMNERKRNKLEATQSAHHHQWPCAHSFAQRTHIAMKFTFSRVPITILPRVSHKINRNNPDNWMSERKFVMANSASSAERTSNKNVEHTSQKRVLFVCCLLLFLRFYHCAVMKDLQLNNKPMWVTFCLPYFNFNFSFAFHNIFAAISMD